MTWDESEVLLGTSWELGEHVVNNKNLKIQKLPTFHKRKNKIG
jgi:hypothetical protein